MPDTTVILPPNSTGQAVAAYRSGANLTDPAYPYAVPTPPRLINGVFEATSFRTLGNAAVLQNLLTIENASGSTILVGVRFLAVDFFSTTAYLPVPPQIKVARTTATPSGGTALSKATRDTADTSSASVIVRGATASDAGAATAITATAGTPLGRQKFAPTYLTLVGQSDYGAAIDLLEPDCQFDPIVLRATEGLLVYLTSPVVTTGNPATFHYLVGCGWEEFTAP